MAFVVCHSWQACDALASWRACRATMRLIVSVETKDSSFAGKRLTRKYFKDSRSAKIL
jgi:hypothetical protein